MVERQQTIPSASAAYQSKVTKAWLKFVDESTLFTVNPSMTAAEAESNFHELVFVMSQYVFDFLVKSRNRIIHCHHKVQSRCLHIVLLSSHRFFIEIKPEELYSSIP